MRWLCSLLLASPSFMAAATAQTSGPPPAPPRPTSLQFDVAQVPATRDSFVFRLRGEERGWAVWQYEIRPLETTQEVVYTATSEFRPVEEDRLRVVVNRLTGQPISTCHHIDWYSPRGEGRDAGLGVLVRAGRVGAGRLPPLMSGRLRVSSVVGGLLLGGPALAA